MRTPPRGTGQTQRKSLIYYHAVALPTIIPVRMIDLDRLEPDWDLAEAHAKATLPGRLEANPQTVQRCPCCFRPIDLLPIKVCANSKELEALGFGFPLYFKFMKYVIILLLLQVLSYNALAVYWSYQDNIPFCNGTASKQTLDGVILTCTGVFVSIARLQYVIGWPQSILRVGSFLLQLFALIYIRDKLTKANAYYDERSTSLSDFSIILKDLPSVPGIQTKVRTLFRTFFSKEYKIEELIIIGHMREFYTLEEEKLKLLKKKKKLITANADDETMRGVDFEIERNEELADEEIEREIVLAQKDELLCEKVIIVLESDPVKEELLTEFAFQSKLDKTKLVEIFGDEKAQKMRMMEAPEPNEIIWEHININRGNRYLRQFLGWVFTILFIAILTVAFYFLLQLKSVTIEHALQLKHSGASEAIIKTLSIKIYVIVYGSIFAIIFFNKFIIAFLLHEIVHFEKHPTKDKEEYSFALKYTLCLFFTTALMTLLVEDVTLHNIFKEDFGVIEEESIMFFVNALFVPMLWLLNPWHILRVIKRKIYKGKTDLTQREANQIMQEMPVSLGKLYAEVLQTIWFTYLYATVIPIGACITLIGLVIHYWIDKYNLLNKSSLSNAISGKMSLQAMKLLDISLLMKPAGELIFDFQIKDHYTIESIVCLGVGIAYLLLPIPQLLQCLHKQEFNLEEKTYSEVKSGFVSNYKTLHPVVAHKKILLQSELTNCTFFPYQKHLKKKISKKTSMSIELALSPHKSTLKSSNYSPSRIEPLTPARQPLL